MNSGKKIDYELKFGPGELNNLRNNQFCLSIFKNSLDSEIEFTNFDCSTEQAPFICQKLQ